MRKYGRTDTTQTPIVQGLRGVGVSVAITSDVGNGFPDAVVASRGRTYLMEFKSGKERDPEKVLTDDQKAFMRTWNAPVYIVWSVPGAMCALGLASIGGEDYVLVMPGFKYQKPEPETPLHKHPMVRSQVRG
jgi:hypothetical protein